MNATERMRVQAATLRAMLAGTEAGKAMGAPMGAQMPGGPMPGGPMGAPMPGGPMPGGGPPGRPGRPMPGGGPPMPGEDDDEDMGEEGEEGEDDDDDDDNKGGNYSPEAGKSMQLPEGTEAVTLIDGQDFMKALSDLVDARLARALAPVHKSLDGITDAATLQMAGLGEVGKSLGALRTVPSAIPSRPGVAAPNARASAAGAVGARMPNGLRDPVEAVEERLKGMSERQREQVIMPLVYKGVLDMHVAQKLVSVTLSRDTHYNTEAVKAALDDAR